MPYFIGNHKFETIKECGNGKMYSDISLLSHKSVLQVVQFEAVSLKDCNSVFMEDWYQTLRSNSFFSIKTISLIVYVCCVIPQCCAVSCFLQYQ